MVESSINAATGNNKQSQNSQNPSDMDTKNEKLFYTLTRRERQALKRDDPNYKGGTQIDKRWEDEQGSAQRVQFLQKLKLSSFEPLQKLEQRATCPTCGKSYKFYCCNCISTIIPGVPQVDPPIKVTVIMHPTEKSSKSSIIPAKILCPSMELHRTTDVTEEMIPEQEGTVVLFPSDDAKNMTDMTEEEISKIKRVVLIDSTWSQTRYYMRNDYIKNLQKVKINTEKTVFWRYQTGEQDTSLATVEALYFFFRDYETTLNCGGNYEQYQKLGKWDNFLWFYAHNFSLIQYEYTQGALKGSSMKHIPGFIQQDQSKQEEYQQVALGKRSKQPEFDILQYQKIKEKLGQSLLLQEKEIQVQDILMKRPKLIMFYFSMHTCPPCREFTPLLSMLYEDLNTEDEQAFEVIFCSGDNAKDKFDHYFAEMPWYAIPWKDPRIKQIAKEFRVKGLPQLIVLRPNGEVVMAQAYPTVKEMGYVIIEKWIQEANPSPIKKQIQPVKIQPIQKVVPPARPPIDVNKFLGESLLLQSESIKTKDILQKQPKLIMFYFSMHTCPPCREFTPLLGMLYEEMNTDKEQAFEVIFCSGDNAKDKFDHYFAEMPWYAIPWKDPRIKQIGKEFRVKGLPQLIVLKPNGEVLTTQGYPQLKEYGNAQIDIWIGRDFY